MISQHTNRVFFVSRLLLLCRQSLIPLPPKNIVESSSWLSHSPPRCCSSWTGTGTGTHFVCATRRHYSSRTRRPVATRSEKQPETQPTKMAGGTTSIIDPSLSSFLQDEMKINVELHSGIIRALQSAYGKHVKVSDLKSFGEDGLKALAASVRVEQEKVQKTNHHAGTSMNSNKRRPSIMVHFRVPHHSTEFDLKWKLGESLLDVAHSIRGEELLGEYMEGTCHGQMSCCSCHVYLDELLYSELEPPSEAEKDMLDLAYEYRKGQSRLGCQVKLHSDLLQKLEKKGEQRKITVTIPAGVNNIWQ